MELLRREPQLGRDDERLEQALADRRAEEQVSGLELDRQVDAQRPDERTRVGSGRDHDGRRGEAAGRRVERPGPAVRDDRVDRRAADVELPRDRDDRRPGLVHVPVLRAVRRSDQRLGPEAGHQPPRLRGRDDARRHARGVLEANRRGQPLEHCLAVRDEQVPAGVERERHRPVEPLPGGRPPGARLDREPAVERRAPLQADAARLDARLPLGHARALEDDDLCAARPKRQGDRQTDHAGTDDEDVGRGAGRGHRSGILERRRRIGDDALRPSCPRAVIRRRSA